MKIINQTSDELNLKEGSGFNFVFSIGFMLFGIGLGYMMYSSGSRGNSFIIPIIPFLLGFLWFLFAPSIIISINKTSGYIIYQKKRLIGTRASNYLVADVLRVETRKNWQIVNNGQNLQKQGFSTGSQRGLQLMVQSFFILKDGKELHLDSGHGGTSSFSTNYAANSITGNEATIAKQVADFLGIPFQEVGPPQVNNVPTFGSDGAIQL